MVLQGFHLLHLRQTNKFTLHLYIPITIHLQTRFYPQVRGRLNRSLFCRKMASQKASCRKIGN
jgi:hypothetical protein